MNYAVKYTEHDDGDTKTLDTFDSIEDAEAAILARFGGRGYWVYTPLDDEDRFAPMGGRIFHAGNHEGCGSAWVEVAQ